MIMEKLRKLREMVNENEVSDREKDLIILELINIVEMLYKEFILKKGK